MRILYLSRNMRNYKDAMYQRNVMDELCRQADVAFYGPGFPNYDPADTLRDALEKLGGEFDAVVQGHAWLSDKDGAQVDPHPRLEWGSVHLPKAVILNKEYVNLEAKLDYIHRVNFDIGFTHHHDAEAFGEATGIPFFFWPFGFDGNLFAGGVRDKTWDLSFSGILQNTSRRGRQNDTRVRVMQRLFHCAGDIPLYKRRRYAHHAIFWNAKPRKRWQVAVAAGLKRFRFLPDEEYRSMQLRSRVFLNTLSPAGLVSPRFAENMASGALVLCEASCNYAHIFPEDCYVTFRSDLFDFEGKLLHYLNNEEARQEIVDRAYHEAWLNHTWSVRVRMLLEKVSALM